MVREFLEFIHDFSEAANELVTEALSEVFRYKGEEN